MNKLNTNLPRTTSQEFLQQLEQLAFDLTPPEEMAILLELPPFELGAILEDEQHPACQLYKKALATIARQIRQRDIELANAGSATAAEAVAQHFRRMTDTL